MNLITGALRAFMPLYRQEWPDLFRYYDAVETIRQFLIQRTGRVYTTDEAMHYATLNISMDWNPNTGLCYLTAKFIQAYLWDVHQLRVELVYLHVDDGRCDLFHHCAIAYNGRYYDTLLPDGVSDWRLLFSGDKPGAYLNPTDTVNYVLQHHVFPSAFFQRCRDAYYPKDHPAPSLTRTFPAEPA